MSIPDSMRRRLEALDAFNEAGRIGERVARMVSENVTGPGFTPHEARRHAEWQAVTESGWLVTRCVDRRWLEARRGDRMVRAATMADLCRQMAEQGNYRAEN